MSSRQQRNRSRSPHGPGRRDRSPTQGNTGRSSSHRDYRQRDDYDRYGFDDGYRQHGHDNRNRRQDESRSQGGHFTGQNPQVTYNINNYGNAPPFNAQMSNVPARNHSSKGKDRKGSEDRGRSRGGHRHGSSQASQAARDSMPPPPPRAQLGPGPSKRRGRSSRDERERSSRNDPAPRDSRSPRRSRSPRGERQKKSIPGELRENCGACKGNHDIRFCPEPNTQDGRTKICPICDNTEHAWCECIDYDSEQDIATQFEICYENRRGLPVLVHEVVLHELFLQKVRSQDGEKPDDEIVKELNEKSGPLTPDFVKRLMPPNEGDDTVSNQLVGGRCVPWALEKTVLESNNDRPGKSMEDPETVNFRIGGLLKGTWTKVIPNASKHAYIREFQEKVRQDEATAERNSDVHMHIRALNIAENAGDKNLNNSLLKSRHARSAHARSNASRRSVPPGKFGASHTSDSMQVTCGNCDGEGHATRHCPSGCRKCGRGMRQHTAPGPCQFGCMCLEYAGHTKDKCNLQCRLCLIEDRKSDIQLKDCKRHCQFHMRVIADNESALEECEHQRCLLRHERCPSCGERHWHQDCPIWLKNVCPIQRCLLPGCKTHCKTCGAMTEAAIADLCPAEWEQNRSVWEPRVNDLCRRWHQYIEDIQWSRVEVPSGGDITKEAWCELKCKTHQQHAVDTGALSDLRITAWRLAIGHMQSGYENGGLDKAVEVLSLPECSMCFGVAHASYSGKYHERVKGMLTDWGKEFLAKFPPAAGNVA